MTGRGRIGKRSRARYRIALLVGITTAGLAGLAGAGTVEDEVANLVSIASGIQPAAAPQSPQSAPVVAPPFSWQTPTGSGIQVNGVHPEPRLDPHPLLAHFPLANFLSFELDFSTPSMSLTFEEAIVSYVDENGQVYNQASFGVTEFDEYAIRIGSNPKGSGANIPMGERIVLPFPLEFLAHNEAPLWLDVALCFAEFAGPNGECDDPLVFEHIELFEYHVPPGETYRYPTQTPAEAGEIWYSGGAYELTRPNGHRTGGFRRNGLTAWVNQRYAWDIAVRQGSGGPECDDTGGDGTACNELEDYFCWDEPILAPAAGEVVLILQGNPDNPEPRCEFREDCSQCTSYDPPDPSRCQFAPGAGTCNGDPDAGLCSATNDTCGPGQFPGSGNQVVLLHDNGEYTTFAHMMQGSNDHLSCGTRVDRGDLIGRMGMSGTGSNPHLHFSALYTPGPEAQIAEGPPMYFNNVEFITPGTSTPRRQLDTGIPTKTEFTAILGPPTQLARNSPQPAGNANEQEPNDTLPQHDALTLPTTVTASLETGEVGDLAVRGDGIEDVYRIDLAGSDEIRVDLTWQDGTQNLDVYALDEELRVLNETRQGMDWQPGTSERACLDLDAGAYYLFVTNADPAPASETPYTLAAESDPQTIACTVQNEEDPVRVDESCEATIDFEIAIHDSCCLSEQTLNLEVFAMNPSNNATVGEPVVDSIEFTSERDAVARGHVDVSDLESCPADVIIDARATDCSGNSVATWQQGTSCERQVVDDTPPTVLSDVETTLLWPPNFDLVPVGFTRSATDNCDANVESTLATTVWSDEAELPERGPRFSPDARDIETDLRLRRERDAHGDGRVYVMPTTASDACFNESHACSASGVPHDQSQGALEALDAQILEALAVCEATGEAPAGWELQGDAPEHGPKQ